MPVFSSIYGKNTTGYFIASHQGSMAWRGLPRDLARVVEDVRQKSEEVKEVAIGLDGDWFLRTNRRCAWKTEFGQTATSSKVELCNQLTERVATGPYMIQSFTYVPDRTGFVAILHNADGSFAHCAWHNIPPTLATLLSREGSKGVSRVAVGVNGSFVVVLNNGCMWWSGVPESLGQLLDDAKRAGRRVATVSLSLISPSWYFVEFVDGATRYVLPQDWHAVINKFTDRAMGPSGPNVPTSPNPTTLPPPHSPPPKDAQYVASSPIKTHNPRPRCGPSEPNWYPATVSPPAPQTVPQVHHPVMPLQPQTASTTQNDGGLLRKIRDIVNLIGEGLKVFKLARELGCINNPPDPPQATDPRTDPPTDN